MKKNNTFPKDRGFKGRPANRADWLDAHESGYSKNLKKRHVQMMALGGAIGTGLFWAQGPGYKLLVRRWPLFIWSVASLRSLSCEPWASW